MLKSSNIILQKRMYKEDGVRMSWRYLQVDVAR